MKGVSCAVLPAFSLPLCFAIIIITSLRYDRFSRAPYLVLLVHLLFRAGAVLHAAPGEEVAAALFRGPLRPCPTPRVLRFFWCWGVFVARPGIFFRMAIQGPCRSFRSFENLFGLTGVGAVAALPTRLVAPSVCVFALFPRGSLPVSRGTGGGTGAWGGVGAAGEGRRASGPRDHDEAASTAASRLPPATTPPNAACCLPPAARPRVRFAGTA